MKPLQPAYPVLVAILGVAIFTVLDAMMKVISTSYPLAQSTGMRYVSGALVAIIFYLVTSRQRISLQAIKRSIPRTICNVAAAASFFLAISRIPLVDAVTLSFLSPFFLSFWGWVFLKETPKKSTLVACVFGLAGAVLIAQSQKDAAQSTFDAVGFFSAICTPALYSLSMVLTRSHSSKDSLPVLVLLPSLIGAIISTPAMIFDWHPVTISNYIIIACVGILGTAGYVCLSWAYSNSQANKLGLTEYTGLIWALILGYFMFQEIPSILVLTGSMLIIGSCIPSILTEKK
ncbi:DMT family transporter (plasmid) [Vibrio tubiashii]|uniref:DMT family transporter n=1 Tax=Vibrio tubiashii TaxID=29498 RepID=UPI003CE46DE6